MVAERKTLCGFRIDSTDGYQPGVLVVSGIRVER